MGYRRGSSAALALAATIGLVAAGPVAACEGGAGVTPEQTIAACSSLIAAGGSDGARLASAFRSRANAYFLLRDFTRAFRDFDEAIRRAPGDARNFIDRGSALGARREFEPALRDLDEAVRLLAAAEGPAERRLLANAYHERGLIHDEKRDYERAIEDFDRAQLLDPGNSGILHGRGNAHLALGRYASAVRDYQAAIRVNPSIDRQLTRHMFYEGLRRYRERAYPPAIILYDGVLGLHPRDAPALYGRGLSYRRMGDTARADADIAAARAIDPNVAADPAWRGE